MKNLRIGSIVVVAGLIAIIATGCVSTGTFKKMEADKNGEIAALQ